jgi:phage antirepressor YoqD-like protein
MNISILHANPVLTMTSREISELTGKEHKHVLADIRNMLDELEIDGPEFRRIYLDSMNRQQTEFALNRELTDTLLTGYSAKLRRIVIARWHELETKPAAKTALSTMDILKLAIESEQGRLEAVAQLALAAPKVAFVEKYVESTGLRGFREVCKVLSANEARFREFVLGEKIMYRLGGTLMPAAQHMDAGRFVVKTGASEDGHSFNTAKFTTKGVEWVAGLWAVHGLRVAL